MIMWHTLTKLSISRKRRRNAMHRRTATSRRGAIFSGIVFLFAVDGSE